MNTYDIGNVSRLTGSFYNLSNALADPTTITLRVKDPNGAVTVYTGGDITHVSTGVYQYDLDLTLAGYYYYRFEGTGALVAAGDNQLFVTNSTTLV